MYSWNMYKFKNDWISVLKFFFHSNPGGILKSPIQSSKTKIWGGKSRREKQNTKTSNFLLFCLTLPEILIYEQACIGGRGTLLNVQPPVVKPFPGPKASTLNWTRNSRGKFSKVQLLKNKNMGRKERKREIKKTQKQATFCYSA